MKSYKTNKSKQIKKTRILKINKAIENKAKNKQI